MSADRYTRPPGQVNYCLVKADPSLIVNIFHRHGNVVGLAGRRLVIRNFRELVIFRNTRLIFRLGSIDFGG